MKRFELFLIFCCLTFASFTANGDVFGKDISEPALKVLVKKSGLSQAELKPLLSQCNTSQQNLYFCTWYNQISSDQKIKQIIIKLNRTMPQCRNTIKTLIADWEHARDSSCKKSAFEEWGAGSMRPIAQAICTSTESDRMIKRLSTINNCEQLSKIK